MRQLTAVEAAYVDAMLDAEGNIAHLTGGRSGGRVLVVIDNSEPEIISALFRVVGAGRGYGYWPTNGTRLMLKWALHRFADVMALLPQLAPYSVKVQAAWRLIEGNTTQWTWHEVDAIVNGKKTKVWRGGPR